MSRPADVLGGRLHLLKSVPLSATELAPPVKAAPAVERDQVSPELPADIATWTPGDVSSWAATLGLPKASLTALQVGSMGQGCQCGYGLSLSLQGLGTCVCNSQFEQLQVTCCFHCLCMSLLMAPAVEMPAYSSHLLLLQPVLQGVTGQQLLQLSDHRLLQLGVLDAAERHALLAARTQLQQEHAPDTKSAVQQPSSSMQTGGKASMPTITERSASGALPWTGAGSRPEEAGLAVDAQPDTPSANTLSRCVSATVQQLPLLA
jgi:hypothetical protein